MKTSKDHTEISKRFSRPKPKEVKRFECPESGYCIDLSLEGVECVARSFVDFEGPNGSTKVETHVARAKEPWDAVALVAVAIGTGQRLPAKLLELLAGKPAE